MSMAIPSDYLYLIEQMNRRRSEALRNMGAMMYPDNYLSDLMKESDAQEKQTNRKKKLLLLCQQS